MEDTAVSLALVGILATVVTALFKLLNDNTKAGQANTEALKTIAVETKKGNQEAKIRNGHLGQQNVQITEMIAALAVKMQNVEEQHVTHQTVEKQEKK